MKFLITTTFSLLLIFAAESVGHAAEGFSVSAWKNSFASAVLKKDTGAISDLVNFSKLDGQAVPSCVECDSKKKMAEARRLFAKGEWSQAAALYDKIPRGGDQWFEAVEERGWAHFREQDYEKALAQTKTLLSPQFMNVIPLEAYFLQSLSQLRICDYAGVLETDKNFKDQQKSRVIEIQNLGKSGDNEALQSVLEKADRFPLRFTDLGAAPAHLPLLFYRDRDFQQQLLRYKVSSAAQEVLNGGSYAKIARQFRQMRSESLAKIKNRIKALALRENHENFRTIQKLNLVEVEAIQRIHTDLDIQGLYRKDHFKKVGEDQLVFMDDGHPWIDELDKYEVSAKTCAQNIRRKM